MQASALIYALLKSYQALPEIGSREGLLSSGDGFSALHH
jgi:hypothetical protein